MKIDTKKIIICIVAVLITLITIFLISFIDSINVAKTGVIDDLKLLYEDYDNGVLRDNITRIEFNNLKIKYSNIKNKTIQNKINKIDEYLRKEEIQKAWTKLNIKYISQNENKVDNGCEAASLLMALQFKGYLKSMNLYDYSDNMPKSDDPQKYMNALIEQIQSYLFQRYRSRLLSSSFFTKIYIRKLIIEQFFTIRINVLKYKCKTKAWKA